MKKKVLFLVSHENAIYNLRKEIVEKLLLEGYDVTISCPKGNLVDELVKMGCSHVDVDLNRHGTSVLEHIKLYKYYGKLYEKVVPDIILGFSIKPNIFGALAAKKAHIPFVANITGLGTAVEYPGILQKITVALYKMAFTEIQTVFFQNKENEEFFVKHKIAIGKHKMLPGSGVNLKQFSPIDYPSNESLEFVFIARIMKEKGIDQYLEAAEYIRNKYSFTKFHICGFCEQEYESILHDEQEKGNIIYHGMVRDVREILKQTHCTVHPTYYPEGLSNVLLESAASERPIITTNRSGTKEVVDDGVNGYLIKHKNTQDLVEKLEKFILLSYEEKIKMGKKGREKIEKQFDRNIVVNKYLEELNIAWGK